jgi:hypothetical protein
MTVVLTRIRVAPDVTISGQAPREVPPGEYQAPIQLPEAKPARAPLDLPLHDCGPWPKGFAVRREEIYDDDGR